MIRLVGYILLSLVVTALIAWAIALPGTVQIEIYGYVLQPSVGLVVLSLVLLVLASILIWAILRRIIFLPAFLNKRAEQNRRQAGIEALSDGYIALEAGDMRRARQLAREARLRLPDNAAAQLLEARADLGLGDYRQAREHYRALIAGPKTSLAALSGLYQQAEAQGRQQAALTFAKKAATLSPGLDWAEDAVFDDITRRGAWAEALKRIEATSATTRPQKTEKRRKLAVLHTALAHGAVETDPATALEHAIAALKLVSDFVPAALIASRVYIDRGDNRRAASLLRRVWRATHHPDIGLLYANTQPGTSAIDRLKQVRELVSLPAEDAASAMLLARAAIDAYEWSVARNALAGFAQTDPTQGICMLMAEIEEGQNADQGKAREWLSRAVRAPRDPAWVADGMVAEEWAPVSPVSGKLDGFEWKVPSTALAPRAPESQKLESQAGDGKQIEAAPALPEK